MIFISSSSIFNSKQCNTMFGAASEAEALKIEHKLESNDDGYSQG